MSNPDSLPYVEAELNYLGPMTERPRYYAYEVAPEARSNMSHEAHTVRIRDMRPISSDISLDTQGFALDAWKDGSWQQIAAGRCIGNQRLVRTAPVTTDPERHKCSEYQRFASRWN